MKLHARVCVSILPCAQVPFLSPLEGSIYLRLDSEGHSNVQYQGFLVSALSQPSILTHSSQTLTRLLSLSD